MHPLLAGLAVCTGICALQLIRMRRERARRIAAEQMLTVADLFVLQQSVDVLSLMRATRDCLRAVLAARQCGVDIDDELRALEQYLADQVARAEEHVSPALLR